MRQPSERQVDLWLGRLRLAPFGDRVLSDRDIGDLAALAFHVAQPTVKPSSASTAAAVRSLAHLAGKAHDVKVVQRNMTRLLANWQLIRDGLEVPEWDGTAVTADVVVLGVRRFQEQGKSPKLLLAVKLKTGLCAGIISCAAVFESAARQFLEGKSGLSRYGCAPEELSGMKFRAELLAANDGTVRIQTWETTDPQRKHNRDLADRRSDPVKCSLAPMPCNACAKSVRECPLAVWLPKPKGEDSGEATHL